MPKPHFMPIEVKDWLSSSRVRRMGFAARGAALQLMIEAWNEEDCSLPDDDEDLADRLGISIAKWKKLKAILTDPKTGFFLIESGRFFSEKLSVLFENASKTSAKRSAAGSIGGKKSASSRSGNEAGLKPGSSEAQAFQKSESEPDIEPETPLTPQGGDAPDGAGSASSSKPEKAEKPAAPVYPPDFETFWLAYPKKIGKGAALKAWKAIKPRPSVAVMVIAIQRAQATEQWRKDGGQFIPHPSTWLHGRRWEDEPEPAACAPAEPPPAMDPVVARAFAQATTNRDPQEPPPVPPPEPRPESEITPEEATRNRHKLSAMLGGLTGAAHA